MTTTEIDTIRVYCHAKEKQDVYEADVVSDLSVTELIAGLDEAGYLPPLAAGDRWDVLHARTDSHLPPNAKLGPSGVEDGDQLELLRATHGAEG